MAKWVTKAKQTEVKANISDILQKLAHRDKILQPNAIFA